MYYEFAECVMLCDGEDSDFAIHCKTIQWEHDLAAQLTLVIQSL